ncbi:MAG: antibiotic biosynthesis monooxygenase [Chloroflexi bacterium]|nr:antibiotic biosynthesis monooxygenase [Chloroflexota bacterium]MBP8055729.1 antibiotic biosynthesis monooxygenase [Chloroflexota bacterium]
MYARIVTSLVKPGHLQALTTLYQDEIVPIIALQPGFNQLLVLRNRETQQEISIALWDTEADMDAFSAHYLPPLMAKFTPLLAAAPKIEIHHLCCQAKAHPVAHPLQMGEASLGLHIEDPLDTHPTFIEPVLEGKLKPRLLHNQ